MPQQSRRRWTVSSGCAGAFELLDGHPGAARSGGEEVHVLVIGESARRDSWSVYGYGRATTPYLDSIKPELTLFSNAVADANLTVFAVPMLLTGQAPEQYDLSAVRGNLVDLAKEAGYSTSWLMNQDVGISTLVGMQAERTVYPEALTRFFGGHTPLDGTLLPAFTQELRLAFVEVTRPPGAPR